MLRGGVAYVLTDTAGLAEDTDDVIEAIGVTRAQEAILQADILCGWPTRPRRVPMRSGSIRAPICRGETACPRGGGWRCGVTIRPAWRRSGTCGRGGGGPAPARGCGRLQAASAGPVPPRGQCADRRADRRCAADGRGVACRPAGARRKCWASARRRRCSTRCSGASASASECSTWNVNHAWLDAARPSGRAGACLMS